MQTLIIDRRNFLDWYFAGISFNDNIYVDLLNVGKYEVDIEELLQSVVSIPRWVLIDDQEVELDSDGYVNMDNVSLKFN